MDNRRFAERVDKVTTILRVIMTVITIIVTAIGIIACTLYYGRVGNSLDNMPDGSGVADGYIVIGKVFGGLLGSFVGLFILAFLIVMIISSIVDVVLSIIYTANAGKYRKSRDIRFVRRNLMIKMVAHGINTGIVTWWIMVDMTFTVYNVSLWMICAVIEALVMIAYIRANAEVEAGYM